MAVAMGDFHEMLSSKAAPEVLEIHSKYISLIEEACKTTKGVFGNISGDRIMLSWNTANAVGSHAEQVWK